MSLYPGLDVEAFLNWSKDPENTAEVFKIQQSLLGAPRRMDMIQGVVKAVTTNDAFLGLYKEKYNPPFPTNDELENCPEGSLGKTLFNHLKVNNIQLDFAGLDTSVFYQQELNPITYLAARGIRTHDVYHAVLGLGTTPLEEYALLSFQLAQFASPYHMVLLSGAHLYTAFHEPEKIGKFLSAMSAFHQLGKQSDFFPGFPFDSHWKTPLSEVRSMLKIPDLEPALTLVR